jgi:hypothetical protein
MDDFNRMEKTIGDRRDRRQRSWQNATAHTIRSGIVTPVTRAEDFHSFGVWTPYRKGPARELPLFHHRVARELLHRSGLNQPRRTDAAGHGKTSARHARGSLCEDL